MTNPFPCTGKGPAIEFQIRDRRGKVVQSFAVPEDRVSEFLRAVVATGGRIFTTVDLYGDTTFSHDTCKRALAECQGARAAIVDPSAHACAGAIVDAVARVAGDGGLNLFVVGN